MVLSSVRNVYRSCRVLVRPWLSCIVDVSPCCRRLLHDVTWSINRSLALTWWPLRVTTAVLQHSVGAGWPSSMNSLLTSLLHTDEQWTLTCTTEQCRLHWCVWVILWRLLEGWSTLMNAVVYEPTIAHAVLTVRGHSSSTDSIPRSSMLATTFQPSS